MIEVFRCKRDGSPLQAQADSDGLVDDGGGHRSWDIVYSFPEGKVVSKAGYSSAYVPGSLHERVAEDGGIFREMGIDPASIEWFA
jgi:hypothetical protein